MDVKKVINWSELSRVMTGGHRDCIRPDRMRKKYKAKVDKILAFIEKVISE